MEKDELLDIDKIEDVLRKTFSDSDEYVKNVIEELIKYTREYETDDLKKFVVNMCLFKKMGYLDIAYNDNYGCFYSPDTSTINIGRDFFVLDEADSLPSLIHEVTHVFHEIAFFDGEPDEFKQIKADFKKNECLNVILAGYIHNLSKKCIHTKGNHIKIEFNTKGFRLYKEIELNRELANTFRMFTAFEGIYDALLDGRLFDGVNITSLTFNEFIKLNPKDKDFNKHKKAIIEEYNRVYNQEGLYDLNYKNMRFSGNIIESSGHGVEYYSKDEKLSFVEVLAEYMKIKFVSNKTPQDAKMLIDNCLKTVFGDALEKYSKSLIDGIYNFTHLQRQYLFNDEILDGEELLRSEPMVSPLHLAFVSEEKRNDKDFMLKFLKKVLDERKDSEDRDFVTRSVGKELCSDIDFLKQIANLNYKVMPLANRGNMSKEDYTYLVNHLLDNNYEGFRQIDIDRLENGIDDYKKLALRLISQDGNNFVFVDFNNLYNLGGLLIYKELALEASNNHCSLGNINPYLVKTYRNDPIYSQIVYNRIMDDPYEIVFCSYENLTKEQSDSLTKLAYNRCLETIEDVQSVSKQELKIIGMMYDKLGITSNKIGKKTFNDEQLSTIRNKLTEDVRIFKEKKKSEEMGKTI